MPELRIVSFLPSATEMVCVLGLADHLVGVSHECDYPPEIANRPIVVRNAVSLHGMNAKEIDAKVAERIRSGASLYEIDIRLLQKLAPNLILTQDLCQVCAPAGTEITQVLNSLQSKPEILWFSPTSIGDIQNNMRALGRFAGRLRETERLIASWEGRLRRLRARLSKATSRPRVFCMEWVDPVYTSGHWVPEMVDLAGGIDGLSRKGKESIRVSWQDVLDWAPEVLIVSPCGFKVSKAAQQATQLFDLPGWNQLPAVRLGRVYATDANSYFARPGPRVYDGIELLAHLIHPELCKWTGPKTAFATLMMTRAIPTMS
jgi:iron complex transport system substrate-binding protein